MKKGFLTLAAIAAIFSATNAATPKTDAKDASATTNKVEGKAKLANTYYVTGETLGGQYILSDMPPADGICKDTGVLPCQISSDEELSSPIDKEDVTNNPDVTVEKHRDSF
nr:hypothetical protein [Mucilaginibacter sp. L294]